LFVGAVGLAMAAVLGMAAYVAFAGEPAALDITGGAQKAPCLKAGEGGGAVAAAVQGTQVSFDFSGYAAGETVAVAVTYPDGRVLDLASAINADGLTSPVPPQIASPLKADEGGDIYFVYKPGRRWPAGCYTFTTLGLTSGKQDTSYLVILPDATPVASQATLSVGPATAPRGAMVELTGSGYLASELISLTAKLPDGTRESLPQVPVASLSGKFTLSIKFSDTRQLGNYTFIAQGRSSGFLATADFVLVGAPVVTPTLKLQILVAPDKLNSTSHRVEIQGEKFNPGEGVTLQLVVPAPTPTHGVVYPLATIKADVNGKIAVAFTLDQRYPSGNYTVRAEGGVSGKVAEGAFKVP
jgi:hypothetical protein